MKIYTLPLSWGATAAERALVFPCDRYLPEADHVYFRAVSVAAPASQLFRWLCQLRVAPYSYDWLDNYGRQSPRKLIPGLDNLKKGQSMMVFELADFERDRHLTVLITLPRLQSLFGQIAGTYMIVPQSDTRCRLVVKLRVVYPRQGPSRLMRFILPWGDLVMMRKQLLTFKELAEAEKTPLRPLLAPCSKS